MRRHWGILAGALVAAAILIISGVPAASATASGQRSGPALRSAAATALHPTTVARPAFAPTTTDQFGCRSGYVCLYTDNTVRIGSSHPHTDYFNYGWYNLSNVVGRHYIDNHQTGGAVVYGCYNYGGTNCTAFKAAGHYVPAGTYDVEDFTLINSIKLCASVGC